MFTPSGMHLIQNTAQGSVLEAPAHWQRIELLSDLHLDAQHPATWQAFARHLSTTQADAVFILGDLFEIWVGDDMRHEAFEAECVQALAHAGQRLCLGLMLGNRDFMVGPDLLAACHAHALPDPMVLGAFGQRHLLTHGDAWCLEDQKYQQYRHMVRNPVWQQQVLTLPYADRLAMARGVRNASEERKADDRSIWADVDEAHAAQAMSLHGVSSLIHGHTHRPADEPFGENGGMRHVMTDWDLDGQRPRAEVLVLDARGLHREPVRP